MVKLKIGDRVAYSAPFLKRMKIHSGRAAFARGALLSVDACGKYCRVRWDDEAGYLALADQDADWKDDVRTNGQLAYLSDLARIGSAAFADTYAKEAQANG